MNQIKGFTLVEILVTAAVSMILLGSIYLAINSAQRHSTGIERKVTAQQDVRPALDLIATEIRMASYNPRFNATWLDPATCGSASALQATYRGIQEATPDAITIEMDITNAACTGTDGDGIIGDCNEMIRYEYLSGATDLYITRETIRCASGTRTTSGAQSFLGASATAAIKRSLRVINNTLNIPLFRYYDQTGAQIAAAGLPAGIPNIRRIEITIAVETEEVDPNTGQRRSMIYSTSVIPRNHAL